MSDFSDEMSALFSMMKDRSEDNDEAEYDSEDNEAGDSVEKANGNDGDDSDYSDHVKVAIQLRNRKRDTLFHSKFRANWKKCIDQKSGSITDETDSVKYQSNPVIRLCPDLDQIIAAIDEKLDENEDMSESVNRIGIAREVFRKIAESFETVNVSSWNDNHLWYNTTKKGINLRPGLYDSSIKIPPAVTMQGEDSHAVIVGRTGSGKSVFLNNIILNLILEYSPWELALYLADFKKVEMSKYMTSYPTPHVRACAATSEIRYVLSLINHLKKVMENRETLFARLGVLNIKDFRELFPDLNIVMPRILFIVDEFQQMFLDATIKQSEEISELLTSITRKGRATGVHLMFASQEMKGTGVQLTNFKMRFALPCDADVSSAIIGNKAASTLEQYHVIVNNKSGAEEDNMVFRVPFPDDKTPLQSQKDEFGNDISYFSYTRKVIFDSANEIGYSFAKNQKFYRENEQRKIESMAEFLSNEKVDSARNRIANTPSHQFIISVLLGRAVVYNKKEYDIENLLIENGKNKCFLGVSNNNMDLAYMQKLLAFNISRYQLSPTPVEQNAMINYSAMKFLDHDRRPRHLIFELNPVVAEMYHINEDISQLSSVFTRVDDVVDIAVHAFKLRKHLYQALINCKVPSNYCLKYFNILLGKKETDTISHPVFEKLIEMVKEYDSKPSKIPELCQEITVYRSTINDNEGIASGMIKCLSIYYRYYVLRESSYCLFPPMFVWISGMENIDASSIIRELGDLGKNGLDFNIYCLFFSLGKARSEVNAMCDYIVVGGLDNQLYNDYIGYTTNRNSDNIVLECRIKSLSKSFAFKKYRVSFSSNYMTSINFDEILLG